MTHRALAAILAVIVTVPAVALGVTFNTRTFDAVEVDAVDTTTTRPEVGLIPPITAFVDDETTPTTRWQEPPGRVDTYLPASTVEQAILDGFAHHGTAVAERAVEVARCESNLDPAATGRAGERGLFQIHPTHRSMIASLGFTWDEMYEVVPNIAVAADIYADEGWSPWACA